MRHIEQYFGGVDELVKEGDQSDGPWLMLEELAGGS